MAFNANTYRMNKYRREAKANLDRARDIKRRVMAGEAYSWEPDRIPHFAKLARLDWRMYLSCRRYAAIGK